MKNTVFMLLGFMAFSSYLNAMTEIECICFLENRENLFKAINSIIDKSQIKGFTMVYVFAINPEYEGEFTTSDSDFCEPRRFDGYRNCYYKDYLHPVNAFRVCMYYYETG